MRVSMSDDGDTDYFSEKPPSSLKGQNIKFSRFEKSTANG